MSSHVENQSRLRLFPLVVFVCTAAVVVVLWQVSRHQDAEVVRVRSTLSADQVALRVEQYIGSRLAAVLMLRDEWEDGRIADEAEYRARVLRCLSRFSEMQAINWVDPDGVIRWVVPLEENRAVLNADLRDHPLAGPVLLRAGATGTTAVTAPLELLQGGYGFAAYIPLGDEDHRLGYLNAVFRVDPVIAACLGPGVRDNYDCEIRDGEQLVYQSTPILDESRVVRSAYQVRVVDRLWDVRLAPRRLPSESVAAASSLAVLFAGILGAGLLTWVTTRWVRSNAAIRSQAHELQRAAVQQNLLMAELDHRVKNTLSAVLALTILTRSESESIESFVETLTGRIRSLARSHEALSAAKWEGVDLLELARLIISPSAPNSNALRISGAPVRLAPTAAAPLSMTFHELATNAIEHGAWSASGGSIDVAWTLDEASGALRIDWSEQGGPPIESPPTPGTGSMLVRGFIEHELRGTLAERHPREGVRYTRTIPMVG